MKAAVLTAYKKQPLALELRDVPVPQPNEGEVLVKVLTAGVNPLDNMIRKGEVKMIVPYRMPLARVNDALEKLAQGKSRGKTVLRIAE